MLNELFFYAKYPFLLKETEQKYSERICKNAFSMLKNALSKKEFQIPKLKHIELAKEHILAYKLSVEALSAIKSNKLSTLFAFAVSKASLLEFQRAKQDELIKLSKMLGIRASIEKGICLVPIISFLKIENKPKELKLANLSLSKSFVELSLPSFEKLIALEVKNTVLHEIESASPSETALKLAQKIASEYITTSTLAKNVNFAAFPPCMEKIYMELISGKNIPHMARFVLATFLNAIGMEEEQIVEAFSHAPNYNEKITRYQVGRIVHGASGKFYKPPSCEKMRAYGLCIANCNVSSPLSYYRKNLSALKRLGGDKKRKTNSS